MGTILCFGVVTIDNIVTISQEAWDRGLAPLYEEVLDTKTIVGGDATNTAKVLAGLGKQVKLLSVVGNDANGDKIQAYLAGQEHLETHLLVVEGGISVAPTVYVRWKTGEKWIRKSPRNLSATPDQLNMSILDDVSILYLDGRYKDLALVLAKEAKQRGIMVVVEEDIFGREGDKELIALADVVFVAEGFLLAGQEWLTQQAQEVRLEASGDPIAGGLASLAYVGIPKQAVITTLGHEGVLCYSPDRGFLCQPGEHLDEVIDTTGAGDTFMAGFLFGRQRGWDYELTMLFANHLAAEKCKFNGAEPSLFVDRERLFFWLGQKSDGREPWQDQIAELGRKWGFELGRDLDRC
jgi:sugar/nucleoside kinase (ribokinase family)